MTIEEIQQICTKLTGVTQDIKWEDHLCFNVGGKMFLVTAPDNVPPSASIKVSDEEFETLPARRGFIPAPYMARHKWIFMEDISLLSKKEWEKYIGEAHQLVAEKLPLKTQKSLGLKQLSEKPAVKAVKKSAKKIAKRPAKKPSKKK
jgi:predicted DNA-binding protein (MmcQ/YjbR family)